MTQNAIISVKLEAGPKHWTVFKTLCNSRIWWQRTVFIYDHIEKCSVLYPQYDCSWPHSSHTFRETILLTL